MCAALLKGTFNVYFLVPYLLPGIFSSLLVERMPIEFGQVGLPSISPESHVSTLWVSRC